MTKTLKIVLTIPIIILIIVIIAFCIYFGVTTRDITLDLAKLERVKSVIYLDNANEIINEDRYVPFDSIPKQLIDAFVSVEDKSFFSHNGINVKRIIGAGVYNVTHGSKAQGASTITQQLIKNTYLSSKKTYDRKLKEIKLALKLEKVLSKEQIMEKYLNSLYFGSGIYGVKSAAYGIFDKELKELSLGECATLAGIVKAPTYYSPLNDIEKSTERRDIVLREMYQDKKITAEEYKIAKNQRIIINKSLIHSKIHAFYTKQALIEASALLDIDANLLANSGYQIATYYQNDKELALINSIMSSEDYLKGNNALAILSNNEDNGINAIYSNNETIDALHLKRQVGSIMKPLAVYLPCFDMGIIAPASIRDDTPISIDDYSPNNYGEIYRGKISIRDAVKCSSNVIPVKLLSELTVNTSKEYLAKFDIYPDNNGLSLALGSDIDGLTALNIVGAYQTIANGGKYGKNTFIRHILDENGNVVYRNPCEKNIVISDSSCYLMTDILVDTAMTGTAKKLSILPYNIASKTGTVANPNDKYRNIDAYNVSYTTKDTLLVWIGGDLDNNIQGGGLPTIIARDIYSNIYSSNYPDNFVMPNSITSMSFDRKKYQNSGEIYLSNNENALSDIFDTRYLPTKKILSKENIDYECIDGSLIINGIAGATIKVYRKNIFGGVELLSEHMSSDDMISIRLDRNIFTSYRIDILDDTHVVYSINY